jgi:hypothetical protein
MNLIFDNVWNDLIANWHNRPRHIAVAYFSSADLSFNNEDILVIDASDESIKTGQTSAKALRRAHDAGARVFCCPSLHAKIYVLGQKIFVGSANSSTSSRNRLVECLAWSDDPHVVAEGVSFIELLSQKTEAINEVFLERIEAIPVIKRPGPTGNRRALPRVEAPRCWLLGLDDQTYPGLIDINQVHTEFEKNLRKVSDHGNADWFWWPIRKTASKFMREARVGDLFIYIRLPTWGSPDHAVHVYRHARIGKITQEPGVAKVFHYVYPNNRDRTQLSWDKFKTLIAKAGWTRQPSPRSQREILQNISSSLHTLWPR